MILYFAQNQSGRTFHTYSVWYQDFQGNSRLKKNLSIDKLFDYNSRNFSTEKSVAYLNEQGEVIHHLKVDNQKLISSGTLNYIIFNKVGENISLFNYQGIKSWSLPTYTYPVISPRGNRILLISTNNASISIYDQNRNQIVPETFLESLLTDFAFCKYSEDIVLGTIKGKIFYYNYSGQLIMSHQIKDTGKYSFIKSIEVSYFGAYVAVLSGLYPETLTLLNRNGKVIWKQTTNKNRNRKNYMFIDEKNGFLFETTDDYLKILKLQTGELYQKLSIKNLETGNLLFSKFDSEQGILLVGINQEWKKTVLAISTKDFSVKWQKDFSDTLITKVEINLQEEKNQYFFVIHTQKAVYSYLLENF